MSTVPKYGPLPRCRTLEFVLVLALWLVIGLWTGAPNSFAKPKAFRFVAFGYVCVHNRSVLLVDTPTQPTCETSIGVGLGQSRLPKFASINQGTWKVSRIPLQLVGDVSNGGTPSVRSATRTASRQERIAETFGTIEVNGFDAELSTRRSRAEVFSLLPELAVVAPNATIRTARRFVGTTYTYGAQVRDPNLTAAQRTAVLDTARRIGVPISINTRTAQPVVANSFTPSANGDQLVGDGVTNETDPRWTSKLSRWSTPPEFADEPTQVRIRQAPIIAVLDPLPADADTLIDATVRIVAR